jgi:hypothetical protein
LEDSGAFRFIGQPDDIAPVIRVLEREGQTQVVADYWIAYRLTFESGERIIAASSGFSRYPSFEERVRQSPTPAYVFVDDALSERRARPKLEARGYRRVPVDGWVAFIHG